MKTNKAFFRIIAVIAVMAMLFSFGGCIKAYNNDPTVVKCGSVKLGLQNYLSIFYNSSYYQYFSQGYIDSESYANYVLNELTTYGVQLDQVKKQGVTLDAEEEAELQAEVDEQIADYLEQNYAEQIDSSITDEAEKYEAELALLKATLKENGSNFKKYRADIEENLRNTALINKLRDNTVGDITVNNDDIKKYFEDNFSTSATLSSFNSSFSSFIGGSSSAVPAYMPVVKAAEPAEDAEEDAETEEPNPYDALFSVQHLLIKFTEAPGDDITDLAAFGQEDEEFKSKMDLVESRIAEVTAEQFLNDMCFNSDVCEDPGMESEAYQFFGYLMAESLISSYYDGFGNAAMMLKYPEWQPEAEETDDASDEDTETAEIDHDYQRLTLSDGTEIMRVYTNAGVHYIILNTNAWNAMYNPEDGMLRVVIYDGEEPLKDGEGIVTTAGSITEEQLAAMDEAYSHIGDKEAEDFEAFTCKSLYDYYADAALTTAQNEAYTAAFNEWKENTKITVKQNIIKAFAS